MSKLVMLEDMAALEDILKKSEQEQSSVFIFKHSAT